MCTATFLIALSSESLLAGVCLFFHCNELPELPNACVFGFFDPRATPHLCPNPDPCLPLPWVLAFALFCWVWTSLCSPALPEAALPKGSTLRPVLLLSMLLQRLPATLGQHFSFGNSVLTPVCCFGSRGDRLVFMPLVNPASCCPYPGNLCCFLMV